VNLKTVESAMPRLEEISTMVMRETVLGSLRMKSATRFSLAESEGMSDLIFRSTALRAMVPPKLAEMVQIYTK
jgi:hypothetical protein